MNTAEKSLHYLVEKWLAPAPHTQIRVIQFGHIREDRRRYVHVEASAPSGSHAIFFWFVSKICDRVLAQEVCQVHDRARVLSF